MIKFHLSNNYKTWRNVFLSGVCELLEGILRVSTFGFVSSSLEMDLLVWLTVKDCKKK